MRGHKGKVSFLAFGQDGGTLASVGHDRTVRLWDTRAGELKGTASGHKGLISSVAFSPSGTTLATAGHDGLLLLRDARTGDVARSLPGHAGCVLSVAFSADGRTLASAGGVERQVAEVRLWDAETGRLKSVRGGHRDWVLWVAFSPNDKTVASGSYSEILVTRVASGAVVRKLTKTEWSLVAFSLSPDGQFLACGGWAFPAGEGGEPDYRQAIGGVQLWETGTGKLKASFAAHERQVTSISYSRDGRTLASGSSDGTIKLWDLTRLLNDGPGE